MNEPLQRTIPTPALAAGAPGALVAKVRGEPFTELPQDLYIPPDALEVFFETFEGPLDLLLYLIRKANLDILDIPMARLTEQYMEYVEVMRTKNLELAAEYLVMAAMLMEIKSRMLLPRPTMPGGEGEDPRAELVRRLLEYEKMKLAGQRLDALPQLGRDFFPVEVWIEQALAQRLLDPESVAGPPRACENDAAPPRHPRGAFGARAHERHPAAAARRGLRRVRRAVRSGARRAGAHRQLPRCTRARQGKPDRDHAVRIFRAHLREAG